MAGFNPVQYVKERDADLQAEDVVNTPSGLSKAYKGLNQPFVDAVGGNTKDAYDSLGNKIIGATDDPVGAVQNAVAGAGGRSSPIPFAPPTPAFTIPAAPGAAPTVAIPTQGYAVPVPTGAKVQLPGQGPAVTPGALTGTPGQVTIDFDTGRQYTPDAAEAQNTLIKALLAQSQGQGPSLATDTLQRGSENNLNAVMAQLASARGGSNPLLQRQALNTSADIQAQTARDAATMRLQEQLQAQGLLGNVTNNVSNQGLTQRSQDMGMATNQAGLTQQSNLAGFEGQTQMDIVNTKAVNDAGQAVYEGAVKGALADAGFEQEAGLAGYKGNMQSAQDLFKAQEDAKQLNAQLGAQYNNLVAQYVGMGLDAEKAKMLASIEIEKIKANILTGQKSDDNKLLGGVLSGLGAMGAAYVGGPAAAPAGAAGGKILADNIDPNTGQYMGTPDENGNFG